MRLSPKILIPIVLAIWVGVGLRYLGFWQGGDNPTIQKQVAYVGLGDVEIEAPYTLNSSYKDPFLGMHHPVRRNNEAQVNRSQLASRKPNLKKLPAPAASKEPLAVRYLGRVQRQDASAATALVELEGRSFLVRPGDSLASMLVKEIQVNALQLQGTDTLIWIYKNQP
ncbi:MAG: hypothetical protein AAFV07_00250 [Bacteroidota bacterium]